MIRIRAVGVLLLLGVGAALGACSSAPPEEPTGTVGNTADVTFLQDMIPHHEQAIAAGRLAANQGVDPRVRAFGARIVREQTPELQHLQTLAGLLGAHLSAAQGAAMAIGRIDQAHLAGLQAESGTGFDRDVIAASITSEQGAVSMAATELRNGLSAEAIAIARPISRAGVAGSEISQLQALLGDLPV